MMQLADRSGYLRRRREGTPMLGMKRRTFITLLGGAVAWPVTARAQQTKWPVIGILIGGWLESFAPFEPAFRRGLSEGGSLDSSKVDFEARSANGQVDRLPGLAADLVSRRPTIIATQTLPAALAAKAATSTIPVVFVIGEDPVKVGLVASFSRPGGNVTGMTNFMNVLGAKRLELVSEAVPTATVLALLVNPNNPNAEADTRDLKTAAQALGRRLHVLTASTDHELEAAFAAAAEQKVGALFINIDSFLFDRRQQIAALAARYKIPTIHPFREYVAAGGLMSYGASFVDAWRQSGSYVGRILKGAKPADLPVLQPTKFDLVINLKVAKALGLGIPPTLIARADEVIE
jgi:putative ABC transport system substrate-binding protein